MTSNKNILLDKFIVQYIYKFTDKFDNELYIFKVNDEVSFIKIKKILKQAKKDNLITNFSYEKDDELFIKVKKQHIKTTTKVKFEKEQCYESHLNLVYYDYKDKTGYYATMIDPKQLLGYIGIDD